MVALKTERRAYLWRMMPGVAPGEAAGDGKTGTLDEVISVLEAELSAGTARVHLTEGGRILEDDDPKRDDKNQLFIAEIKRHGDGKQAITLLINRGDPDAVSPAFLDSSTGKVRVAHPTGKESPGWSAHLVISSVAEGLSHRACFEKMDHVSSSLVMLAIDRMVARALANNPTYRYEVITHPKGKPKVVRKPYRPTLDVDRVQSEKLARDLEIGELTGLTLTRKKICYAGVGVDDLVKRQEEKIHLSLKPAEPTVVQKFLGKFIPHAKAQGFESVQFDIQKLPGKQSSHPTLKLDDHDALEQLYVRAKRLLGFEVVLEQCYGSICPEIEAKMIELLADKDEWG
jgi:hypothetical protein